MFKVLYVLLLTRYYSWYSIFVRQIKYWHLMFEKKTSCLSNFPKYIFAKLQCMNEKSYCKRWFFYTHLNLKPDEFSQIVSYLIYLFIGDGDISFMCVYFTHKLVTCSLCYSIIPFQIFITFSNHQWCTNS